MNVRQAILRAADHIEQHPEQYDFHSNSEPKCGTPGCMMGWIGCFSGAWKRGAVCLEDVIDGLGFSYTDIAKVAWSHNCFDWCDSAKEAAHVMRLYADKYHPAEIRDIPIDIRAMFETVVTDPDKVAA